MCGLHLRQTGCCTACVTAEESAKDLGIDAVWIIDEAAARQWQARLNANLMENDNA
jgi:hypothetical protein